MTGVAVVMNAEIRAAHHIGTKKTNTGTIYDNTPNHKIFFGRLSTVSIFSATNVGKINIWLKANQLKKGTVVRRVKKNKTRALKSMLAPKKTIEMQTNNPKICAAAFFLFSGDISDKKLSDVCVMPVNQKKLKAVVIYNSVS